MCSGPQKDEQPHDQLLEPFHLQYTWGWHPTPVQWRIFQISRPKVGKELLFEPFNHFLFGPAFNWNFLQSLWMIWGVVHDDDAMRRNIWEQIISKPLLKMLPSHFVMVIAWIFLGLVYESGIGYPTHITSRSKNNLPCSFTRWVLNTPYSTPCYLIILNPKLKRLTEALLLVFWCMPTPICLTFLSMSPGLQLLWHTALFSASLTFWMNKVLVNKLPSSHRKSSPSLLHHNLNSASTGHGLTL